jgi:4'-phosphopantetheinyl transferase
MNNGDDITVVACSHHACLLWEPYGTQKNTKRDCIYVSKLHKGNLGRLLECYGRMLSAEEEYKAARFTQEADRTRFLLGRMGLRYVAEHYWGYPQGVIRLTNGAYGKPQLVDVGFHFNISHSGDWVVLATSSTPVGIDVEQMLPKFSFDSLLDACFSEQEQTYLQAELASDIPWRLWTTKEAIAKLLGTGLANNMISLPSLPMVHQAHYLGFAHIAATSFLLDAEHAAAIATGNEGQSFCFLEIT